MTIYRAEDGVAVNYGVEDDGAITKLGDGTLTWRCHTHGVWSISQVYKMYNWDIIGV